jgi:hypothetical protein
MRAKKLLPKIWPMGLLFLLIFAFFWKFFLRGLVPIPADVIVGIYFPWRDHIWNNLVAGVPIKNGLLSDVVSIIYPWRIYGIDLLKKGIWPLWIPHALSGAPLLANFQSGLLYPLNFLFIFFSNINAWSLYIFLQPVLASFFCFVYLRNLKLSILPSLIGAIIFAFSGFMMVWLEYGIVGHAGLWLPLVLLAIDKLFKKVSGLWVAIGGLAIGFSLLAGYPQLSAFLLLASFFYAIWKFLVDKKSKNYKAVLTTLVVLILGIGLAAVQLLPGLELWQLSIRQVDPTAAAFGYGLNPLKNLILFLAPDFYGNPATGNFWGWGAYNESAAYVSLAGLLLALITLLSFTKNKTIIFFKILLALSLLMAFNNPLSNFIYSLRLPVLASSSAGRFLFLVNFSLAVLAAFSTSSFLKKEKRGLKIFPLLALVFIILTGLLLVIYLRPGLWPDNNLLDNLIVARRNLILPTILLLTSLPLLLVARLIPFMVVRKIFFVFLFLLIVFDLFRFGFKYNPFTDRSYLYPETHLTDFLKKESGFSRFTGLIPQSMFIPYNLSSPEGYEPLMIKRYSQFANQINEASFSQAKTGSRWVIVNRPESPLLSLLGTKYLLSFKPDPESDWEPEYYKYPEKDFELVFQHGFSQVYERKNVLPRAFIIHDFQALKEEQILKTLMDENFGPAKTLLLEKTPGQLPKKAKGDDRVEIDESTYFDNQVIIKANLSADGYLFLSDSFYPGWKAFVDKKETKIYRANYTFRAVFVPEGEHEVKFLFQPQSFKMGLRVSIFTLFILVALLSYKPSLKTWLKSLAKSKKVYGTIRSRCSPSQRSS